MTREWAETVAIQALSFIAGTPDRLGRFLSLTGLGPDSLRMAARDPNFLAGVLDHLASDDSLMQTFAEENGIDPHDVARARSALGGSPGHSP
jgi:hypothetical protein